MTPQRNPNTSEEGKEHRTVGRVTAILEFVSANPDGVRMPQLVQELDAPRSSVNGLVSGLVARGYLEVRGGRYLIGSAVGALLSGNQSLNEAARPIMRQLAVDLEETVMLSIRTGDTLVYVDAAESAQLIRYSAPLHQRRELYPASSGKVWLAYGQPDFKADYIQRRIEARRRAAVQKDLAKVVERGYAINLRETIPDVASVAVPILKGERLVAVLAVAGPDARMEGHLQRIGSAARDAASRIGKAV
jgi:DNA-binding IclR family transcriptional regulator